MLQFRVAVPLLSVPLAIAAESVRGELLAVVVWVVLSPVGRVIATALMVKLVELGWALLVVEVAVTVTVQSAFSAASVGEVKIALALEVAVTAPQPLAGLILHWTALLLPFDVDAVSVTWPPAGIVFEDVPLLLRVMDGAAPPPPQLIKERRKANRKLQGIARRRVQRGIAISDSKFAHNTTIFGPQYFGPESSAQAPADRITEPAHAKCSSDGSELRVATTLKFCQSLIAATIMLYNQYVRPSPRITVPVSIF